MLKSGLNIFIAVLLATTLSGCLKWYCCGNTIYDYKCEKGADVIYVEVTGTPATVQSNITDSLNIYRAQGFVCGYADSTAPYWNCVQGDVHKKNAEAGGQPCVSSDQGLCSSASDPQCAN